MNTDLHGLQINTTLFGDQIDSWAGIIREISLGESGAEAWLKRGQNLDW